MGGYETFYPMISCSEDTCGYIDHLTSGLYVASSYAGSVMNQHTVLTSIPEPHVPAAMVERAGDWGGYRVVKDWSGKAPFTPEHYVTWLRAWGPNWAATWDYPCGDELAAHNPQVVQDRQDESTLRAWYFWHHYKAEKWAWTPSVQGWTVADYQRHAQDLYSLIIKMRDYYQRRDGDANAERVGIGSLVRRKPQVVKTIIDAVADVLPEDVSFHAWGMNKKMLSSPLGFRRVRSSDTGSYNGRFGRDIEAFKATKDPQRKVVFRDRLPKYQEEMHRNAQQPKQYRSLFDGVGEAV